MIGMTQSAFPNFTTWDSAFLPRMKGGTIRGVIYATPVAIAQQSKHPKEAWMWIKRILLTADSNVDYATMKYGPPWRKDWKQIGTQEDPMEEKSIVGQMESGFYKSKENFPKPKFISDRIAITFQEVILGKKTPQKALDDAAADIDKTLAY